MNQPTTRDKILQAAVPLLLAKGFAATGIDEIITNAGVSKGSFYHAFKSKEELGRAALDVYFAAGSRMILSGEWRQVTDPVERAHAFVAHVRSIATDLWAHGCLLGIVASDLKKTVPSLVRHSAALFGRMEQAATEVMTPYCNSLKGERKAAPEQLARYLMVVIEGGIVMAQAHDDVGRLDEALGMFQGHLRALAG